MSNRTALWLKCEQQVTQSNNVLQNASTLQCQTSATLQREPSCPVASASVVFSTFTKLAPPCCIPGGGEPEGSAVLMSQFRAHLEQFLAM